MMPDGIDDASMIGPHDVIPTIELEWKYRSHRQAYYATCPHCGGSQTKPALYVTGPLKPLIHPCLELDRQQRGKKRR